MRRRRSKARKARLERGTFSSRKRRRSKSLERMMLQGDEEDIGALYNEAFEFDVLYGSLHG